MRKGTTIAAQLGSSMDVCKKKTPADRGHDGGTRRPLPNNLAGGDRAESNVAPKRTKTAPGVWPARPQNPHLWNKGLQRAKVTMLNKLEMTQKFELEQWSSDSKDNGQMLPIQLDTEHKQFLNGLPGYLSYGEGRSSTYFCPCSPAMKDWHREINMDDLEENVRRPLQEFGQRVPPGLHGIHANRDRGSPAAPTQDRPRRCLRCR